MERFGLSSRIEFDTAGQARWVVTWRATLESIVTNNVGNGTFFLALWLLICVPLCHAASRFDGTWRGTYNSLHYERLPQAGDPLEQINEFELRLHVYQGTVRGEFQRRGTNSGPDRPVTNGKMFGDRACFDVVNEYDDMRWCVVVHGNKLSGSWSGGPEGGPIFGGAGAGVRSYDIDGRKVAR